MEAAPPGGLNREPDIVHEDQDVEDDDSEAEIPLEDSVVDDIGSHSEVHRN